MLVFKLIRKFRIVTPLVEYISYISRITVLDTPADFTETDSLKAILHKYSLFYISIIQETSSKILAPVGGQYLISG